VGRVVVQFEDGHKDRGFFLGEATMILGRIFATLVEMWFSDEDPATRRSVIVWGVLAVLFVAADLFVWFWLIN
jgi:hypothetical protein